MSVHYNIYRQQSRERPTEPPREVPACIFIHPHVVPYHGLAEYDQLQTATGDTPCLTSASARRDSAKGNLATLPTRNAASLRVGVILESRFHATVLLVHHFHFCSERWRQRNCAFVLARLPLNPCNHTSYMLKRPVYSSETPSYLAFLAVRIVVGYETVLQQNISSVIYAVVRNPEVFVVDHAVIEL